MKLSIFLSVAILAVRINAAKGGPDDWRYKMGPGIDVKSIFEVNGYSCTKRIAPNYFGSARFDCVAKEPKSGVQAEPMPQPKPETELIPEDRSKFVSKWVPPNYDATGSKLGERSDKAQNQGLPHKSGPWRCVDKCLIQCTTEGAGPCVPNCMQGCRAEERKHGIKNSFSSQPRVNYNVTVPQSESATGHNITAPSSEHKKPSVTKEHKKSTPTTEHKNPAAATEHKTPATLTEHDKKSQRCADKCIPECKNAGAHRSYPYKQCIAHCSDACMDGTADKLKAIEDRPKGGEPPVYPESGLWRKRAVRGGPSRRRSR